MKRFTDYGRKIIFITVLLAICGQPLYAQRNRVYGGMKSGRPADKALLRALMGMEWKITNTVISVRAEAGIDRQEEKALERIGKGWVIHPELAATVFKTKTDSLVIRALVGYRRNHFSIGGIGGYEKTSEYLTVGGGWIFRKGGYEIYGDHRYLRNLNPSNNNNSASGIQTTFDVLFPVNWKLKPFMGFTHGLIWFDQPTGIARGRHLANDVGMRIGFSKSFRK